jgi:hypothetical protein
MLRWKCEVEILVSVRRKNGNVRMGDEIGGGMRGADRLPVLENFFGAVVIAPPRHL